MKLSHSLFYMLASFVLGFSLAIILLISNTEGKVLHHNNHPDKQCETDTDCYGHGGYEL